jgi:hypothetical protein
MDTNDQALAQLVDDPKNYDPMFNTSRMKIDAAVEAICGAWAGQAKKV